MKNTLSLFFAKIVYEGEIWCSVVVAYIHTPQLKPKFVLGKSFSTWNEIVFNFQHLYYISMGRFLNKKGVKQVRSCHKSCKFSNIFKNFNFFGSMILIYSSPVFREISFTVGISNFGRYSRDKRNFAIFSIF